LYSAQEKWFDWFVPSIKNPLFGNFLIGQIWVWTIKQIPENVPIGRGNILSFTKWPFFHESLFRVYVHMYVKNGILVWNLLPLFIPVSLFLIIWFKQTYIHTNGRPRLWFVYFIFW
jgi:hypothetical protein